MKLYNTLGRQKQSFTPANEHVVNLYSCGPTVYDYAHIGNLRSFVFDDTLRRALQVSGYKVNHVMNITDVGHLASDADEGDDKLETGAAREHQSVWDLAERYIKAFESDVNKLNILEPNAYHGKHGPYARATDFIAQQQLIISLLLDKGFAYTTIQAIYFDVSKLDDYGKLTGQKLGDKETAARHEVVVDKNKRNPQDFALWFFKVERFAGHSMSWPSEWGEGFPGWHLECSAIVHATLGEPLDIHTGGVDHIGTHHTNEIAQTEAAFGKPLARFWLHNEYLLVDNKKMSKSLGNYYALKDIIDKGIEPLALRLLFLQSHYRSEMNFKWESLHAAVKNLKRLGALADLRFQASDKIKSQPAHYFSDKRDAIIEAIQDDLSTPAALAVIDEITDDIGRGISKGDYEAFNELLFFLDELFGLNLLASKDISPELKDLVSRRESSRTDSDWAKADEFRAKLLEGGLEILDTQHGPIWQRI